MLQVNQTAPYFAGVNQLDQPLTLTDFAGQTLVLYFYPKDDTPGCTIEANDFSTLNAEFAAAGAKVIGVSKDDCASHRAFIDKFQLSIDLIADTGGEMCAAYGVWQLKEKNGVKNMGIVRSTFIIDAHGKLAYVEYGVNPDGHAQAMLQKVQTP
ncbi:peroxiredoxin [Thiosulfatimonas sediminis]|uniref:thioredoxin-dependent peroxiredoxin n=1 Tax=Thiosulfatimonas sediminis TaxID=2675054 RepID=A0A6F8PVG1_9GAMM|nr:peroxiredoxin [Thiosulfatimonas sediminis]BBP46086.1 peroxiredoxin [Thiosulfatimonas sediminis]